MAGNSRIDELTKRLEKEPGSRLFAQLAEELRKEGELAQAIRVCREGLLRHPSYPSARMTLGRALLDTGAWAEARTEFDAVLKAAPDNILASRFLAECHEGLGELDRAVEQYQATLRYVPGDKQITARLEAIRQKRASAEVASAASPTVVLRAPTAPEPEALARTVLMPAPPRAAAAAPAFEPAPPVELPPIPLVDADEEFELERPYDAMARASQPAAPSSFPTPELESVSATEATLPRLRAPDVSFPPLPVENLEVTSRFTALDEEVVAEPVEEAPVAPTTEPAAPAEARERAGLDTLFRFSALEEVEAPPASVAEAAPAAPARPVAPPPAPTTSLSGDAGAGEIVSPTLAELYFSQGHIEKAIEVYRKLLRGGGDNEKARLRLIELEALVRHESASVAVPTPSRDERRAAIVRTIDRLERLLSAVRSH